MDGSILPIPGRISKKKVGKNQLNPVPQERERFEFK
jgi:hypothetical protein